MKRASVVGAGLAGCEAAWQLAKRGICVDLYEMKPEKRTPAHQSDDFCELCCSNSMRANNITNAVGLLKEELRRLSGLCIACADETRVEAGGALAVDRERFAALVTSRIRAHPNISVHAGEVTDIPENDVIIATGPLTSDKLAEAIRKFFGGAEYLHFYDAAAPIVTAESVDMSIAWFASRYDKGEAAYLNCPMNREEYESFHAALVSAEEAPVHGFEDKRVFEGCMPVEVMARRGADTLCFGPLKPVGLVDPRTGERPFAVVQLRADNAEGTLFNLVGFQTHLRFPEQKRVFSMIPGLGNADFVRYGVMHRNTFLDSPRLLGAGYEARITPRVAFAGQMTGVEGYVESMASGFVAGVSAARRINGLSPLIFPRETAIGALSNYISDESIKSFQPMNINFGLLPPLAAKVKGKAARYEALAQRALDTLDTIKEDVLELI